MANHKSAAKKARADVKRNARNRAWRSRLRTQIKTFRTLLDEGKKDEVVALMPETLGLIDRSARAGLIHDNTASRYKSRLQLAVNKLGA